MGHSRPAYFRSRRRWCGLLGLCSRCRLAKARPGRTDCDRCSARQNAYMAARRARRAPGLCQCCHTRAPRQHRKTCSACLAAKGYHQKRLVVARRAAMRCTSCGRSRAPGDTHAYCAVCADSHRIYHMLRG